MTPEQFKAWRAERGWSQAKAATALGLSRESVGFYELGRRRDRPDVPVVIPQTVELACAALAVGLTGWRPGLAPPDATGAPAAAE